MENHQFFKHHPKQSVQETFIFQLWKDQLRVSIYLHNGIQLCGVIKYFDRNTIILKDKGIQLVYKRHMASIVPQSELIKA